MTNMPFKDKKIPIINSLLELQSFINHYPDYSFCLYFAYKEAAAWEKSTSRVYMNQVVPKLLYVPINILKDDANTLREVYDFAIKTPSVIAINHTQPHKSNPVLNELFNVSHNTDVLIKDTPKAFTPYDLNGDSFIDWFKEVDHIKDKTIIIVGVGGVGQIIVNKLKDQQPSKIYLIDLQDKTELAESLSNTIKCQYFSSLDKLEDLHLDNIILINATGKEGISDDPGIIQFLQKHDNSNNIFIDLRPQLNLDIVNKAKELNWQAYTGHGMNARNDYTLLQKIASVINSPIPPYTEFTKLVAAAS